MQKITTAGWRQQQQQQRNRQPANERILPVLQTLAHTRHAARRITQRAHTSAAQNKFFNQKADEVSELKINIENNQSAKIQHAEVRGKAQSRGALRSKKRASQRKLLAQWGGKSTVTWLAPAAGLPTLRAATFAQAVRATAAAWRCRLLDAGRVSCRATARLCGLNQRIDGIVRACDAGKSHLLLVCGFVSVRVIFYIFNFVFFFCDFSFVKMVKEAGFLFDCYDD